MLIKNNKFTRSMTEKNKDALANTASEIRKQLLYEDVIVLEVLEENDKSKYLNNFTCKKGIYFVCAYAHLHGKYFAHELKNVTEDYLRANLGSNSNIIGREFKLEVKSYAEKDIKEGKLHLMPTDEEKKNKSKNKDSDVFFSLGNLNLIGGSILDRFEWKFIEPKENIGYIWSKIIPKNKS